MICPPAFSGYLFIQCSSLFRKNSFPSCASLCTGCVLSIYSPTSRTLQTQCKSCLKFCIKIHPECPRLLPVSVGDTRLQSIPGPYFFFLILWTFQVARDFIMLSWLSAIHISRWIGKFDVSRLPVEWDRRFCNHAELDGLNQLGSSEGYLSQKYSVFTWWWFYWPLLCSEETFLQVEE